LQAPLVQADRFDPRLAALILGLTRRRPCQ
jgi:hypothetical protein